MTFADIVVLLEPNKSIEMNNYKSWKNVSVNNKLYLQVLTKEWMKISRISEEEEVDILILKIFMANAHFYFIAVYLHPIDQCRRMHTLNLLERYTLDDLRDEQLVIVGDFNTDLTINKKYSKDEQKIFEDITKATKFEITSDYTWVLGGDEFKDKKSLIDFVLS